MGGQALPPQVCDRIESNHGEVVPNLIFLGKQAVYSLSSGHRIAAFGGAYDVDHFTSDEMANATQPLSTRHFTASSTEAFKNKLSPPRPEHTSALAAASAAPPPPIDILITNEWPTEITHLASKEPPGFSADWGVPAISSVLSLAQPKYHFVSNSEHPSFWEREPFRWPAASSSTKHATRFISLAQMGNKDKARWFYAFSLPPLEAPPAPVPANTTSCPLDHALQGAEAVGHRGKKRPFGVDESENTVPDYIFGGVAGGKPERKKQPPKDYVCRICNQPGHFIQDCEQAGQSQPKKPRAPPKEILPSECWFCLSNPKVTKHLIATIGTECYVTLPKGQLPNVKEGAKVPGGGHVLIIPIAHFPTLKSVPAEQAASVLGEVEQTKSALRACYAQFGCAFLSFEMARNSGKGGHAHIQACPIPQDLADNAEDVFRAAAQEEGFGFVDNAEQALQRARPEDSYFRLDLPNGKVLVHFIRNGRFNLQFGRTTLAKLLEAPQRADWKVCARSDDEEKQECKAFKQAFAKFDPLS